MSLGDQLWESVALMDEGQRAVNSPLHLGVAAGRASGRGRHLVRRWSGFELDVGGGGRAACEPGEREERDGPVHGEGVVEHGGIELGLDLQHLECGEFDDSRRRLKQVLVLASVQVRE